MSQTRASQSRLFQASAFKRGLLTLTSIKKIDRDFLITNVTINAKLSR